MPKKRGPRHSHKLSAEVMDFLSQELSRSQSLSSSELASPSAKTSRPLRRQARRLRELVESVRLLHPRSQPLGEEAAE
jgi:hypothetical protein